MMYRMDASARRTEEVQREKAYRRSTGRSQRIKIGLRAKIAEAKIAGARIRTRLRATTRRRRPGTREELVTQGSPPDWNGRNTS